MFGLGKSYSRRQVKDIESTDGILMVLSIVNLQSLRIDRLRRDLSIKAETYAFFFTEAFFLGTTQGELRQYYGMSQLSIDDLMYLVICIRLHPELKADLIKNEEEFSERAKSIALILSDTSYRWYKNKGLGFSSMFTSDIDQCWDEFECELIKGI